MKISISTDLHTHLVDVVKDEVQKHGHEVMYFGPEPGSDNVDWPDVTYEAVSRVVGGEVDEAIVMCWSGTGCSIVANKLPGIRAALCIDAETARGARIYNHANVLALSLRATPEPIVREIMEKWFTTGHGHDEWNEKQIKRVGEIEQRS